MYITQSKLVVLTKHLKCYEKCCFIKNDYLKTVKQINLDYKEVCPLLPYLWLMLHVNKGVN